MNARADAVANVGVTAMGTAAMPGRVLRGAAVGSVIVLLFS
jgi:hypothetical protein